MLISILLKCSVDLSSKHIPKVSKKSKYANLLNLDFKVSTRTEFFTTFHCAWLFAPNFVLEHIFALCPELRSTTYGGLGRIPFWKVWLYRS